MSWQKREEASWVQGTLYGVFHKASGGLLAVVEASDERQARERAEGVARTLGWPDREQREVRPVDEWPMHAPTFFEGYFPRAS